MDQMNPEMQVTDVETAPQVIIHDTHEISMAKAQCYKAAKNAMEIHKLLKMVDNLESWMQAKITLAAEYLESVASNLEYDVVSATLEEGVKTPLAEADQKVDTKTLQALRSIARSFHKTFKQADISDKVKGEQIDAVANALSNITDKIPHHGTAWSKPEETKLTALERQLFDHFLPVVKKFIAKEAEAGDLKKAVVSSVKKLGAKFVDQRKAHTKGLPKVDESLVVKKKSPHN